MLSQFIWEVSAQKTAERKPYLPCSAGEINFRGLEAPPQRQSFPVSAGGRKPWERAYDAENVSLFSEGERGKPKPPLRFFLPTRRLTNRKIAGREEERGSPRGGIRLLGR